MSENISFVQAANIEDERTSEVLRRSLFDLMHTNGWNLPSLHEAFNRHLETTDKRPVHVHNIKSALSGIKHQRPLAFEIEKFMNSNRGPYVSVAEQANQAESVAPQSSG